MAPSRNGPRAPRERGAGLVKPGQEARAKPGWAALPGNMFVLVFVLVAVVGVVAASSGTRPCAGMRGGRRHHFASAGAAAGADSTDGFGFGFGFLAVCVVVNMFVAVSSTVGSVAQVPCALAVVGTYTRGVKVAHCLLGPDSRNTRQAGAGPGAAWNMLPAAE